MTLLNYHLQFPFPQITMCSSPRIRSDFNLSGIMDELRDNRVPNISAHNWKYVQNALALLYPKNKLFTTGANESETNGSFIYTLLDHWIRRPFSNVKRLEEYSVNFNENGLCFTSNRLDVKELYRDNV